MGGADVEELLFAEEEDEEFVEDLLVLDEDGGEFGGVGWCGMEFCHQGGFGNNNKREVGNLM